MALQTGERAWGGTFLAEPYIRPDRSSLAQPAFHLLLAERQGQLTAGIRYGTAEDARVRRLAPRVRNSVRIPTTLVTLDDLSLAVEDPQRIEVHRPERTGLQLVSMPALETIWRLTTGYGAIWDYFPHAPGKGTSPSHLGTAIVQPGEVALRLVPGQAEPRARAQEIITAALRAAMAYEIDGWG